VTSKFAKNRLRPISMKLGRMLRDRRVIHDDMTFNEVRVKLRRWPQSLSGLFFIYTVSQKNVLTLKRYSSKLQGAILMKFGRKIQNTLE